jgi:hypothetical protein
MEVLVLAAVVASELVVQLVAVVELLQVEDLEMLTSKICLKKKKNRSGSASGNFPSLMSLSLNTKIVSRRTKASILVQSTSLKALSQSRRT